MLIGDRLRILREQKDLKQGDIEKRTGLLRCYVSRVENGHTVPSVETLQKWTGALNIPLYQLFWGAEQPKIGNHLKRFNSKHATWGSSGKGARMLSKFRQLFSQMDRSDIDLVLDTARKMARTKRQ